MLYCDEDEYDDDVSVIRVTRKPVLSKTRKMLKCAGKVTSSWKIRDDRDFFIYYCLRNCTFSVLVVPKFLDFTFSKTFYDFFFLPDVSYIFPDWKKCQSFPGFFQDVCEPWWLATVLSKCDAVQMLRCHSQNVLLDVMWTMRGRPDVLELSFSSHHRHHPGPLQSLHWWSSAAPGGSFCWTSRRRYVLPITCWKVTTGYQSLLLYFQYQSILLQLQPFDLKQAFDPFSFSLVTLYFSYSEVLMSSDTFLLFIRYFRRDVECCVLWNTKVKCLVRLQQA